jgi:protease-4
LHDESIQGVVIKIDTPGGSAFASEKILEQIVALKAANKPVVVLMGSVAASGGYWIAMAADKIYASPATITGSIGVFAMFPTFDKSLAELGIYTDGAGTNAWSGSFRIDREVPDNLKRLIQSQVDYNYNEFVSKVSQFRDIPTENVKNIAEGQVWTGQEALENGLIDALGGIDDAIKEVEHLANMGDLDYGIINLEQKISPAELFAVSFLDSLISVGLDFSALGLNNGILNIISKKVNELTFPFTKFNDPQGLYAYCFCEIN